MMRSGVDGPRAKTTTYFPFALWLVTTSVLSEAKEREKKVEETAATLLIFFFFLFIFFVLVTEERSCPF